MRKLADKFQTEPTMNQNRERHHSEQGDQKRQQIVDKAGELFAKYGFRKCTTEDIASACNLTKAALYHYFDSKEAIFASVIDVEGSALLRRLRAEVENEPDPAAKVLRYARTRFDTIKALANLYGFTQVQRPIEPQFEEVLLRFQEEELRLVQGILDGGVATGRFRQVNTNQIARVLLGGSKGVMLEYVLSEDAQTVQQAITDMANIVCFGLVQ